MLLRAIAFCACALVLATAAWASPSLTLSTPGQYTPGTPFHCQVVLVGATDLAGFTMDLVLTGQGVAGTDFGFTGASAPAARYVFVGQATAGFSSNLPGSSGGSTSTLTVGDSLANLSGEVATETGVNDLVADVTITTLPTTTGNLVLSFDSQYLDLYNSSNVSIAGYSEMVAGLSGATLTPEPATLALVSSALAILGLRRRGRGPVGGRAA